MRANWCYVLFFYHYFRVKKNLSFSLMEKATILKEDALKIPHTQSFVITTVIIFLIGNMKCTGAMIQKTNVWKV